MKLDSRTDDPDTTKATPRWPAAIGTSLCLIGLAIAAYLTYAHFDTHVVLACPETGIINCQKVTTSSYSAVFGVPVALLGLAYFVGMLPLQLPAAWRSSRPAVRIARVAAASIGVVMIMWLIYAELFGLDSICLYCTGVHVVTFLLFVTVILGTLATSPDEAA